MPFKSRPGFKREDTDRGAAKADEVDVEVDGAVGGPGSRSASVHVQEAASLDGDGDGDDDRDGVHSPRYAAALLSSAEDPTAKDARFVTSKRELWAFYVCMSIRQRRKSNVVHPRLWRCWRWRRTQMSLIPTHTYNFPPFA